MRWYTYDTEVFRNDFLVVFKEKETGEYAIFHNDNEGVRDFISDDAIYCGFNSKGYDQYIIKAIANGFAPEEVKQVNDWIIGGGQGWDCPLLNNIFYRFNNVDIMDDMQVGLSLKAIEGHLGMSIEETEVDFNLDRPLTPDELALTIKYCKHDVDATEYLTGLRKNYLENKMYLGRLKGIDDVKSLAMTNAKLTALYLDAKKEREYDDEREYKYPENLRREYIPKEVFKFFDRLKDTSIPDDELFSSKLDITVGGCPVTLGFGGIHGAIPFYQESETETRLIRNYDVASYYPHLMTVGGYTSRNIPDPQIYADMLERRMVAKKSGDISTANALKLVANTTYGAMLNQYNELYDSLMGRSVCISGQLYLLELSQRLISECPSLKIIQLNTDGIMVSFDKDEYDKVLSITDDWQTRGYELEEDKIKSIVQKDVNNYIEIPYDGDPKIKGGYLVRGIAKAGAFNVNNSMPIVSTAIVNHFVKGIPANETINNCTELSQFQTIAKAGSKYESAHHMVDGEQVRIQKVNRIYATKNKRYGKLFKVHAETGRTAKIENLPERCIIDNDNKLTIDDIDKSYYIDVAIKRINDFMGIKPEKKGRKKMAETKTTKMTIFQKILKARLMFMQTNPTMSGKNMELCYEYFELKDIVPVANSIFEELGLLPVVTMDTEKATMTLVDIDAPENSVPFCVPFVRYEGNRGTNVVQALGSTITYYRRYLYMVALDICEADGFDCTAPKETPTPETKTAAPIPAPVVAKPESTLTASDGNASDIQIKQLKEVLKKLKEKDPTQEPFIAKIAVDTKGFKVVSRAECEKITKTVTDMLKAGE